MNKLNKLVIILILLLIQSNVCNTDNAENSNNLDIIGFFDDQTNLPELQEVLEIQEELEIHRQYLLNLQEVQEVKGILESNNIEIFKGDTENDSNKIKDTYTNLEESNSIKKKIKSIINDDKINIADDIADVEVDIENIRFKDYYYDSSMITQNNKVSNVDKTRIIINSDNNEYFYNTKSNENNINNNIRIQQEAFDMLTKHTNEFEDIIKKKFQIDNRLIRFNSTHYYCSENDKNNYSDKDSSGDNDYLISINQINDNYCDCENGADESITNSCINGKYTCFNKFYIPNTISSYKLNDGVCDCFDGTDEEINNNNKYCENTAYYKGYQLLLSLEKQLTNYQEISKTAYFPFWFDKNSLKLKIQLSIEEYKMNRKQSNSNTNINSRNNNILNQLRSEIIDATVHTTIKNKKENVISNITWLYNLENDSNEYFKYIVECFRKYFSLKSKINELNKKKNLVASYITKMEDFFTESNQYSEEEIFSYHDENGFNINVLENVISRLNSYLEDVNNLLLLEEFQFINTILKNNLNSNYNNNNNNISKEDSKGNYNTHKSTRNDTIIKLVLNHDRFKSCLNVNSGFNYTCSICLTGNSYCKILDPNLTYDNNIQDPNGYDIGLGSNISYSKNSNAIYITDDIPCKYYNSDKLTTIYLKCSLNKKINFLYKHRSNCVFYFELESLLFCNDVFLKNTKTLLEFLSR